MEIKCSVGDRRAVHIHMEARDSGREDGCRRAEANLVWGVKGSQIYATVGSSCGRRTLQGPRLLRGQVSWKREGVTFRELE